MRAQGRNPDDEGLPVEYVVESVSQPPKQNTRRVSQPWRGCVTSGEEGGAMPRKSRGESTSFHHVSKEPGKSE